MEDGIAMAAGPALPILSSPTAFQDSDTDSQDKIELRLLRSSPLP